MNVFVDASVVTRHGNKWEKKKGIKRVSNNDRKWRSLPLKVSDAL